MKKIIIYSITILMILGCNICGIAQTTPPRQLNISILLDLSDRINPQIHPNIVPAHAERDIEIIKYITEYFKTNMVNLTAWNAKGKIRVFFSPPPSNPRINDIAAKLNIDCSILKNPDRKDVYDNITNLFAQKLTEIYNQTIQRSGWEGCDIWRFFKDDVRDYCIESNTNYRNILIILTDGYIFHPQSMNQNANRYAYLLGERNVQQ
ncbi:MAG: hypothetical protein LBT27_00115, partial [Prevotellaceae bacterium]|nr:hypothetical protein [Prevotellaceae bacterium]